MDRFCLMRRMVILAGLLASGCQSVHIPALPAGAMLPAPLASWTTPLPAIVPPEAAPSPEQMPAASEGNATEPRLPRPTTARALDPGQALCLAVQNAAAARVLEARRHDILTEQSSRHPFHPVREAESWHSRGVLAEAMALQAEEARNQAGGAALQLFYRLAQAQAQAQVLRHSLVTVEAARSATAEQIGRGLPVLEQRQALDHQQIELRHQAEELARGIDRLSNQLDGLLGLAPPGTEGPIWPLMTWDIGASPAPDEVVGTALAQRPQLILLRRLIVELDGSLQPLARAVLGVVDPLLSIDTESITFSKLLFSRHHRDEVDGNVVALRAQLQELLAWRERTIAREARAAALDADSAARRIALARERYLGRRQEVERLRAKSGRGLVSSVEIDLAELEVDKAQAFWIEQVTQWHLAAARLEQAQGILPARCDAAPLTGGSPIAHQH